MFSLICHFASAVVGALIPVFYSYKVLKRPTQKSLSYWSKYWAVFGSFLGVDVILTSCFVHYFIPFYELLKFFFLLWAVCPQTAGAQFVFDKVLSPFIRRHEKNMDVYIERFVSAIINHGPDMAMTAGATLLTLAKNLHALSLARADAQGRVCLPLEHATVEIAEIVEQDEVPLKNAVEVQESDVVEVKPEPIEPYVEDLVYKATHQQEESKSASTTKTPLPTKRKRGRRPGSAVTPSRRKPKAQDATDDPKILTVVDVVDGKPVRPRRTRAPARNKLVIVGGDDSASDV